jgi:hypothetical protein
MATQSSKLWCTTTGGFFVIGLLSVFQPKSDVYSSEGWERKAVASTETLASGEECR